MYSELDGLEASRPQRLYVGAPRDHAKSTVITLEHVARQALSGRDPYIWVCSDTQRLARKHLARLAYVFEHHEPVVRGFPGIAGKAGRYSADKITLGNGCLIECYSTETNVRGAITNISRPALIVCDDPEGEQDFTSPIRRERNRDWFYDGVVYAARPDANIILVGTAGHPECLLMDVSKRPGWRGRIFRALDPFPARIDLWEEWADIYLKGFGFDDDQKQVAESRALAFYERNAAEMNAGAGVLWPERHSLYSLMCEWAADPQGFASERQNQPVAGAVEWPEEYFNWSGLWVDEMPPLNELQVRTVGLDPSKTEKQDEARDYAAFVRCGLGRDNLVYMQADHLRGDANKVASRGADHNAEFAPHVFVVESNMFLALFADMLEREVHSRSQTIALHKKQNLAPKFTRIRSLGPWLHGRKIRLVKGQGTRLLWEQMRAFPAGQHDDSVDAAALALTALSEIVNGRNKPKPPTHIKPG